MAFILSIDTATEICSVAISEDDRLLSLEENQEGYQHASQITLLVEACIKKAKLNLKQVDAVAISAGPGSYTGLRIGVSTAKGICYALNIPLISVSTLAALASASSLQYPTADYYIPMIDARRMEVYTSIYDRKMKKVKTDHALILEENSFDTFLREGKKVVFSGNGSNKFKTLIKQKASNQIFIEYFCSAEHLLPIAYRKYQEGIFEDLAYYTPFYLKPPNITTPKSLLGI